MRPATADTLEDQVRVAMAADNWATVDLLAHQLDRAEQRPRAGILAAALWYAEQGLHVFPLRPGTKIPHQRTRGLHDATNNPDRIHDWWTRWPNSNVAIATGHHVDVIDIDGPTGVQSWARLLPNNLPILGTTNTPRPGGTHIYVPATGNGNQTQTLPGIDVRGAGGYVVAPPSVIAAGPNPGTYTWRRPLNLHQPTFSHPGDAP